MKKSAFVICALISMWTAGPVLASTNLNAGPFRGTTLVERPVVATTAGTERAVTESNSYAAREKAAPELANVKAGDSAGIYIGGSTLAIVLLIVLLVILL